MHFNPTAITFIGYLVLMVLIGFYAWHHTRSFGDYILGGRRLGGLVTALSVGASDMSGWLLMGVPGAAFVAGVSESWIAIGLTIGAWLNWKLVAARLRLYTEVSHNALTLPDYFRQRFEDKSHVLPVMAAVVILVFFTIYCASGMVAGARLFENIFRFEYSTALWVGAAVTIAYVFIGGFLAVSWTDTFQASLMCLALVVTPVAVAMDLGGFSSATTQVAAINPDMLNMFSGQTAIGIISLLAWGLGYCCQPHILVRFMATRSISVIPNARRISITWMIFCLAGSLAVGFFGAAFYAGHPEIAGAVNENHERVFIELCKALFNPWIAGILMSAILAAVMSTLSCQLLVCSSTLTEDFYRRLIRPKAGNRELMIFSRGMVLLVSVIAIVIASDPNSLVLLLVSYAWAGFGAAFGPVILLSVWWKRMTRNGALAGMLTGAVTVLVWHHFAWFGLYELLPGFVLGLAAIVIVSLLGKEPRKEITDSFATVEKRLVEQS